MKLFDRSGLFFKYHGDVIQWRWPWARSVNRSTYHSALLNRDFNSFKDYWTSYGEDRALLKLGKSYSRMQGFDLHEEVLPQWAARTWPNEHVICLVDIDIQAKGPKFWSMLTPAQRSELYKDVVVLRCKDKTEMQHLVESISPSFARAYAVVNGDIIDTNAMNLMGRQL
jgi:hypothetical protein